MNRPFGRSLPPLVLVLPVILPCIATAAEVDFVRDVRPIFSSSCYSCHGAEKQKGGLRLDARAPAFKGGESGPAIIPGKSDKSLLVQLVSGADEDRIMPAKGPRLSPEQVGLLKRWVDEGANWPASADTVVVKDPLDHWAFKPIARPGVPAVQDKGHVRNPIDAFVVARLDKEGLSPAGPATRRQLIRRVCFDLIGLPPTPDEIDAFEKDLSADAYEKLVDRLLASPRYGERWGRHWLDVVRFADTHGFEMNQGRPNAWRYRDWVIRSLNDDKPYDRFMAEQIAGDAMGADEATGFLVAGPWDQVKSPDPVLTAQQRADELHDMTATTGSTFLGLTIGCSRCHDHKFDPIPQTDYYAIKACFAGVQHGERPIRAKDDADRIKRIDAVKAQLASIDSELQSFQPKATARRVIAIYPTDTDRLRALTPAEGPAKLEPGAERGAADDTGGIARLPTLGTGYLYWKSQKTDVLAWTPKQSGRFRVWVSWGCGWKTHAPDARYLLDRDGNLATTDDRTEIGRADHRLFADKSGNQPGRKLWSGFLSLGVQDLTPASAIILRAGDDEAYVSADLLVLEEVDSKGNSGAKQPHLRLPVSRSRNVDRFDPVPAKFVRFEITQTTQAQPCIDELEVFTAGANSRNVALAKLGTRATASGTLPGHDIHRLEHINDGNYGNEWSWISNQQGRGWVQLEFPAVETIDRVEWSRDRSNTPRYDDRLATGYAISVSADGQTWKTVATSQDRLPRSFNKIIKVPGDAIYEAEGSDAGRLTAVQENRGKLQSQLNGLIAASGNAYAGRFTKPEITRRLGRGDVTQPKEEITPGTLTSIGPARITLDGKSAEQDRRLALAKWLSDPANPLPARVIVNRLWHYHFGRGIVDTPSDFGHMGGKPSHPELLDWLAAELVKPSLPGSSDADAWRLKRIHKLIVLSQVYQQSSESRPEAMQKDAGDVLLWRFPPRRLEAEALRDTILAVTGKLDLTAGGPGFDLFEPNTNYVRIYVPKQDFGPPEFRRMVYQYKPRLQPDGVFAVFDCPDAAQIAPKRNVSTTPLQALNLLNSRFMLQQSDYFAERLKTAAPEDVKKQADLAFQLAFGRHATEKELSAAENVVRDRGLPILCRALFNANEFLYLD